MLPRDFNNPNVPSFFERKPSQDLKKLSQDTKKDKEPSASVSGKYPARKSLDEFLAHAMGKRLEYPFCETEMRRRASSGQSSSSISPQISPTTPSTKPSFKKFALGE